ncbi:InlB B-repeat-containing protein [Spirochaeta dissipatitropha]
MYKRLAALALIAAAVLWLLTACENPVSVSGSDSIADTTQDTTGGGSSENWDSTSTDTTSSDSPAASLISISFDGNGATEGSAPEGMSFESGAEVTIPGRATLQKQDSSGSSSSSASMAGSTEAESSSRFVIALPDPPPEDPYLQFAGWNTQADGTGTSYHPGSRAIFTSSTTLYARWFDSSEVFTVQLEIEEYQGATSWIGMDISGYHVNNHYVIGDQFVLLDLETMLQRTGNTYTLPENKLFGGWRNIGSGALYQPGEIWELSNSSTNHLRFRLELIDAPFTLELDYNGATELNGPLSLEIEAYDGIHVDDLPQPEREGMIFKGWWSPYEDSYVITFFDMPAQNTSLIAKWAALVEFESNGGSAVTSIEIELDNGQSGTFTEPAPPTRSSYVFEGWFSDPDLTQAWNFSTPITAGMTLYAGWRIAAEILPQHGHDIGFVDWLFDPPTLEVRYRMDDQSHIEWIAPGLEEGLHYTIDNSLADIVSGGKTYRVSRLIIADRDDLPEGDYSDTVEFRIVRNGISELTSSRFLDIPANRTPNIVWFPQTTLTRTSSNSMSLSIAVWDYETRPENLTVNVISSNPNAVFPWGASFAQNQIVAHHSSGSLHGVPVQVSNRSFTMVLNSTEPITTQLTIRVTDADGTIRTESRIITIN